MIRRGWRSFSLMMSLDGGLNLRVKVSKVEVLRSWLKVKGTIVESDEAIYHSFLSQFNKRINRLIKQLYLAGILTQDDLRVMAAQDSAIRNLCVELGVL